MGKQKSNKTRVLFILFILLILLGNMFPFKNSIFRKNDWNPGFVHFVHFVDEQNEQNEQNPGFVHFCLPPQINKTNKMNKTRVLAIFVKLTFFYRGECSPQKWTKWTKWTKAGFCSFLAPHQINIKDKMNKTRVLAIFLKLSLFYRGNVPKRMNKMNKMNKTRVLFIFASPPKSTKQTKWTKPGF